MDATRDRTGRERAHAMGRTPRAGERGFSLIEILTAVAILGILVALGVGSYQGWSRKYRVENDVKELFADLMDVRARAMHRKRVHFVTLTAASYRVQEDTNPSPDGNGILESSDAPVRDRRPLNPIDPGGVSPVRFNADGTLALAAGTVRIVPPDGIQPDYDCIALAPTRIKMGRFTGGACEER